MSSYFTQYLTVAGTALAAVVMVGMMLGVARVLRPNNPSEAKETTYECGVDPVGGQWSQTQVRYYLFALLFVIFDVEAVFIYPWAVVMKNLGRTSLVEMVIFVAVLAVGILYAWKKEILKWV